MSIQLSQIREYPSVKIWVQVRPMTGRWHYRVNNGKWTLQGFESMESAFYNAEYDYRDNVLQDVALSS